MVGREFVLNEDMGEWTIHVDAGSTSLELSEIGSSSRRRSAGSGRRRSSRQSA
jgi:hypothetical protein